MNAKRDNYILGQLYGYLSHKLPDWNMGGALFPLINPLTAVTQMILAGVKAHKVELYDPYISARMCVIDAEFEQPVHAPALQGAFAIGEYQYNRTVKKDIDSCGLTLEQIAEKLGVTHATVDRWYSGEVKCPADKQFEIQCLGWEEEE